MSTLLGSGGAAAAVVPQWSQSFSFIARSPTWILDVIVESSAHPDLFSLDVVNKGR